MWVFYILYAKKQIKKFSKIDFRGKYFFPSQTWFFILFCIIFKVYLKII